MAGHRRRRGWLAWIGVLVFLRLADLSFVALSPGRRAVSAVLPGPGGAGVRHTTRLRARGDVAAAYELPPLPFDYDALEPIIDKETMKFHHDNHHNTYIQNINKALDGQERPALVELQKAAIQSGTAIRNSGGGAYNHNFYWLGLAPVGRGGEPSDKLAAAIKEAFGSFDEFKAKFEAAGAPGARFGSGWVWLVVKADGQLAITSTPNQDNPLMDGVEGTPGIPILVCDLWEHAYYLKYQYRRPEYVKAFWSVVNWNQVNAWYDDAVMGKAPMAEASVSASA